MQTRERDKLENAPRESGYAIVSIGARAAAPASSGGATDTTQLRAAVEALVNEAADSEVARTAQSVTAKLASRKLVAVKVGREWRLPAWQFDPDVPTGVLPDLATRQAVFPGRPMSLSRWMLTI